MSSAFTPVRLHVVFCFFSLALHAQQVASVKTVIAISSRGEVQSVGKVSTDKVAESVILSGAGTARLEPHTEIRVPDVKEKDHSLQLLKGRLYLNISADDLKKRGGGEFRLKTPAAMLAVKGTGFFVDSGEGGDTIGVHSGTVSVEEAATHSTVELRAGQAVNIRAKGMEPPRPLNGEERGYLERYPWRAADASIIQGRVVDQSARPIASAVVELRYGGADGNAYPYSIAKVTTDASGRFLFKKAGKGPVYLIWVFPSGELFGTTRRLEPKDGETPEIVLTLIPPQVVTVVSTFQPNGSRNFEGASLEHSTRSFSRPTVHDAGGGVSVVDDRGNSPLFDVIVSYDKSMNCFRSASGSSGFYDAGSVDQLSTAEEKRFGIYELPCIEGHTYVVRTNEGKYANFLVASMKAEEKKASEKRTK